MNINIDELNDDPDINLCDRFARSKGIKYYYEVKRKNIEYWRAWEVLVWNNVAYNMFEKKVRGDRELSSVIGQDDKTGDKFEYFQSLTPGASEL